MTNPKAPWPRRTDPGSDRQDPRTAFGDRLRLLGAADDVVDEVLKAWDDPDWDDRDQWVAASDETLRAELVAIEKEYRQGTQTPEEEAMARYLAVYAEAEGIVAENIDVVTGWVGDDPVRAEAVYERETLPETGKQRKGVLEHVQPLMEQADGHPA